MREDVELQSFVNEVSLNGTGPNGGIGSVSIDDVINETMQPTLLRMTLSRMFT